MKTSLRAVLLLLLVGSIYAVVRVPGPGGSGTSGSSTYTGVGDIQTSGVIAYWSSRAFSAADAGAKALALCTAGDANGCPDALTDSTGKIVVPSGCSGTNCTAKTIYDHSGNGFDQVQATEANRYVFDASDGCLVAAAGKGYITAGTKSQSQPYSGGMVANKTANASFQFPIANFGSSGPLIGYTSAPNTPQIYGGTGLNGTATDGTMHSIQGLMNGGSSKIAVDGSSSTGSAGTDAMSTTFTLGLNTGAGTSFAGKFCEGYWFAGDISANFAAISANQHPFWGF